MPNLRLLENDASILDLLTDTTVKTEGLIPGQTPLRITNDSMRQWNTIQGVPVDKSANIPADRQNFFFVKPGQETEVIKRQWRNYFKKPERYGLSEDATLEDAIKKFDQQNPKNKINLLKEKGIDVKKKLKEFSVSILNVLDPVASAEPVDQLGEEPRETTLRAARSGELGYMRPITEEEKAQAVVDIVNKERGAKLPLLQKVQRAVSSPEAQAATEALLLPHWAAIKAGRGIAGAVQPDTSLWKMIVNSAKQGIMEPDKTEPLSVAALKAHPNLDWRVAGSIGALVEIGMIAPTLYRGLINSAGKEHQFAAALRKARQTPVWSKYTSALSNRLNMPVEEADTQLARYLWQNRKNANYFKILNYNLKNATGVNLMSEAGFARVGKGKGGLPMPEGTPGVPAKAGAEAIPGMAKTTPEAIPQALQPLLAEAKKYGTVEEFITAQMKPKPSVGVTIEGFDKGKWKKIGVIQKIEQGKVYLYNSSNPKEYQKYDELLDNVNKWLDSGAYRIKEKQEKFTTSEISVFGKTKKEKTIEQLTSIWQQAQGEGVVKQPLYEMTQQEFDEIPIIRYIETSLKDKTNPMKVPERNKLAEQLVDMGIMTIDDFNAMTGQHGFGGQVSGVKNLTTDKPIPSKPVEGQMGELLNYIGQWQMFRNLPLFAHQEAIARALAEGKNVPKKVIDSYKEYGWITSEGYTTDDKGKPITLKEAVESYGGKFDPKQIVEGEGVQPPKPPPEVGGIQPPAIPPEDVAGLTGPRGEGGDFVASYEKQKDIWIGNKDVRVLQSKIEKRAIQEVLSQSLGKKGYDDQAKDIDRAIQIYIDTQRNPEHLTQYYDKLTDAQKKTVDLSQNLPPQAKIVADQIANSYKKIGLEALDAEVIRNVLDNYAARVWKIEGKPGVETFRKFATKTRHAKARTFETIIEGWANGYNLKVEGATNNLQILKEEIVKTIEDKKFLKVLQRLKTLDGEPLLTHKQLEGYARVEHPNFKSWKYAGKAEGGESYGRNFFMDDKGNLFERRELYAPKQIAQNLNNILGISKLKGIPAIDFVTKYNAVIKSWILQSSLFHHMAFMRSYYLGTNHKAWNEMGIRNAYRQGIKAITEQSPIIMLGVRKGLTLGLKQDWDEELLREKSKLDKYLEKMRVVGPTRQKVLDLRQKHVDFLFGEFGAGLKAKAFMIEFKNMSLKHPEKTSDEIATMVANLINDDFGGLHLQRMGRNPTVQHMIRLFLLAPDWTESNVNTMTRAIRTGSKAETNFYRRFWAGIFTKGILLTVMGNALMAGMDEDGEGARGWRQRFIRNYRMAWRSGRMKWLDVDVTALYRMLGGSKQDRKYFSIFGHFKDPLKFVVHPWRSLHHKGSVIYKMFHESFAGVDWAGRRFTTTSEFLGMDKEKGLYKTTRKGLYEKGDPKWGKLKGQTVTWDFKGSGPIGFSKIIPFALNQARGSMPVQIQNLLSWMAGEMAGFDALLNSAGLGIRTTYVKPKTDTKKSLRLLK